MDHELHAPRWASGHELRTVQFLYREYDEAMDGEDVVALVRQEEETVVHRYVDKELVVSLEKVIFARYIVGRLTKEGVLFWEKRTNKWVHATWAAGEGEADFMSGKANLYGYARLIVPPGALIW
jgi:hypothetical protein